MPSFFSARDRSIVGSAVTATVDDDFEADWLTNGFPSDPFKITGALSAAVAVAGGSPALEAGVVALMNHTIDAGNPVTFGGDLAGVTLTPPTWRRDGFSVAPFQILDPPVPVGDFTVDASGNSIPIVIPELWVGECTQFEYELFIEPEYETAEPFPWESQIAPNDDGTEQRRLVANTICSDVGLAQYTGWYESTHRGKLPSLFIRDSIIGDPWLVVFRMHVTSVIYDANDPSRSIHMLRFEFLECERSRQ